MSFSLYNSISPSDFSDNCNASHHDGYKSVLRTSDEISFLRDKLRIPSTESFVERPRITNLLRNSRSQFPATLISGRAGTGKTSLAAIFARSNENVTWYSIESTDTEWSKFSRYLSASVLGAACTTDTGPSISTHKEDDLQNEIARFLLEHFLHTEGGGNEGSSVIVLDDIDHIFDANWFGDFFHLLLYSLPPAIHLILLSRSRPPSPLWRLRSKQMLNVIDEKVIAFTAAETEALFHSLGLSSSIAKIAQKRCFGRVSKLMQFASDLTDGNVET